MKIFESINLLGKLDDLVNLKDNLLCIQIISSICIAFATYIYRNILKKIFRYITNNFICSHTKNNIDVFNLNNSFTFSQNGDDRIFTIINKEKHSINTEIDFSYTQLSIYAGLVLIPVLINWGEIKIENKVLIFKLHISGNIKKVTLEFKTNAYDIKNKVFGAYDLPINGKSYNACIPLQIICDKKDAWTSISEIVMLVRSYDVTGSVRITLSDLKII